MMNPFLDWIGYPKFDLFDIVITLAIGFLAGCLYDAYIKKE